MPKADFLVLPYPTLQLLFARDVFYASTYRKVGTEPTERGRVHFGDKTIPDFDLDGYVKHLFPGVDGGPALLGTVCQTDSIFGADSDHQKPDVLVGEALFSLAIPSDSVVRTLELAEFRFLPFHLRPILDRHGFRAVRFEGKCLQFFCDAQVFIPGCLAYHRFRGDHHDGTDYLTVGAVAFDA